MFFNFIEFQYRFLKDLNITILSFIFIISFFNNLSIFMLKDFRFYYYLILIVFNARNSLNNFYKYESLFKTYNESKKFIYNNRKYLIINDLLFAGYLYINYYYFNPIQIYLFVLTLFSFLTIVLTRKPKVRDIEMGNIGIEPVIDYHINNRGRRVLRFQDNEDGL